MHNNDIITLKPVDTGSETDIHFLYDLLLERDPIANISHKKMPTYEEHQNFCYKDPYDIWYIIMLQDTYIGSIYLTYNDEIGIFILKYFQNKGYGKMALEKLMSLNPLPQYFANVSPRNEKSLTFFKKNGFNQIQITLSKETM